MAIRNSTQIELTYAAKTTKPKLKQPTTNTKTKTIGHKQIATEN